MQIEFIKEVCEQSASTLSWVAKNGVKSYQSFEIDCAELDDYNHVDNRYSDKFKALFSSLNGITGPVLYFFEIVSETDSQKILEEIRKYGLLGEKAVPAIKSKPSLGSRILYVGKVRKAFGGRLIQHLGFYKVKKTQGLQLYYWTKSISLKLRLHVYEFEAGMEAIMPVLECAMAEKLKPLVGKHK